MSEVQELVELVEAVPAVFLVPDVDIVDPGVWAAEQTAALTDLGLVREDDLTRTLVITLLHALAVERRPDGMAWRAIVVPGIEEAPIAVDLGFVDTIDQTDETLDELAGASIEAPLGSVVTDFSLNDVAGVQVLRFAFRDDEGRESSESGELWVAASLACRRHIPAVGSLDILALAATPRLETLLGILPYVYELLTGDQLAESLRHTARSGPRH